MQDEWLVNGSVQLPHHAQSTAALTSNFVKACWQNEWRCGVTIPVPLACEASALPYELHPLCDSLTNFS